MARFVFGDELLPSESLTAQPMWTASSLVAETRSHEDVATGLDTALKVVGEVHHSSCFFSAVSNLADVKYADKKQLDLESACTKWISILKLCHGASSVSEYIFLDLLFEASILTTWLLRRQLMGPKLFMHVAGRPRMAPTVSRSMSSLTSVMVKTSMMTLVPLPPMLFFTPRCGMMTTRWVTNFVWRGAGQLVSLHFLVEFDI